MATKKKATHGGARPGAGRPVDPDARNASITGRVTPTEREQYDQLGGIEWMRKMIAREHAKLSKRSA